jgi:hypothetical protein
VVAVVQEEAELVAAQVAVEQEEVDQEEVAQVAADQEEAVAKGSAKCFGAL